MLVLQAKKQIKLCYTSQLVLKNQCSIYVVMSSKKRISIG